MSDSTVETRVGGDYALNAICLTRAVLCADCDVVSDSPHDHCLVCGSRSLLNISRLLGGTLSKERATVVETTKMQQPSLRPVLTFPRSHRTPIRRHQRELEMG